MTNTSSYVCNFTVIRQAWLALQPTRFEFAIVPRGSAFSAIKCCPLHLAYHKNCVWVKPCDIDEWRKPFLSVNYFWGEKYSATACALDAIKKLLNAGAIKSFDNICCHAGDWVGVGDADACLYNNFSAKDMSCLDFKKFISVVKDSFNDFGSGVWNEYKFIFIASAEDPRRLYEDAEKEGVAAILKVSNLYRCARLYGDSVHFSCLPIAWDDDNCYKEFVDCIIAGRKFAFDYNDKSLLNKKRAASPPANDNGKAGKPARKSDKISKK